MNCIAYFKTSLHTFSLKFHPKYSLATAIATAKPAEFKKPTDIKVWRCKRWKRDEATLRGFSISPRIIPSGRCPPTKPDDRTGALIGCHASSRRRGGRAREAEVMNMDEL